ncbi:MAG: cupin domain-containing protein [Phycisphaerae bacterium]|nr:cupin domain-containing protein [Phycisphaerae bacterium]
MNDKKAFVTAINDKKEYQRLIPGAPTTFGMKSGRVYLQPGADCGTHSTEDKEEQLVFLQGQGTAQIGTEKFEVGAGKICYIPPQTEHNILNTGNEPLVYIFCVAPVRV